MPTPVLTGIQRATIPGWGGHTVVTLDVDRLRYICVQNGVIIADEGHPREWFLDHWTANTQSGWWVPLDPDLEMDLGL